MDHVVCPVCTDGLVTRLEVPARKLRVCYCPACETVWMSPAFVGRLTPIKLPFFLQTLGSDFIEPGEPLRAEEVERVSRDDRVACPRCKQDWIVEVRMIPLEHQGYYCPECSALWLQAGDVGTVEWIDLETYLA